MDKDLKNKIRNEVDSMTEDIELEYMAEIIKKIMSRLEREVKT